MEQQLNTAVCVKKEKRKRTKSAVCAYCSCVIIRQCLFIVLSATFSPSSFIDTSWTKLFPHFFFFFYSGLDVRELLHGRLLQSVSSQRDKKIFFRPGTSALWNRPVSFTALRRRNITSLWFTPPPQPNPNPNPRVNFNNQPCCMEMCFCLFKIALLLNKTRERPAKRSRATSWVTEWRVTTDDSSRAAGGKLQVTFFLLFPRQISRRRNGKHHANVSTVIFTGWLSGLGKKNKKQKKQPK